MSFHPQIIANFPPRHLEDGQLFLYEIGKDGFNFYKVDGDTGTATLQAASSSVSTLLKTITDMLYQMLGHRLQLDIREAGPHA